MQDVLTTLRNIIERQAMFYEIGSAPFTSLYDTFDEFLMKYCEENFGEQISKSDTQMLLEKYGINEFLGIYKSNGELVAKHHTLEDLKVWLEIKETEPTLIHIEAKESEFPCNIELKAVYIGGIRDDMDDTFSLILSMHTAKDFTYRIEINIPSF